MKLTEKISWLIGRVQRSLFPHLNECLPTPLTEQEKRLVSILEIVVVERYVPRIVTRIGIPVASLLTGRLWPVRSWPRRSIVIRRPATCTEFCNRQPTCAGYADSEL